LTLWAIKSKIKANLILSGRMKMAKPLEPYIKHLAKDRIMIETLRSLLIEKGIFTETDWKRAEEDALSSSLFDKILNEFEKDFKSDTSTSESQDLP
jgi:hypothetical protein